AGDQEAGRDPHGPRQGQRGGVARGGEDGPHPLRDGRRDRGDRQEGDVARLAQASSPHAARAPLVRAGSLTMKAAELKDLPVDELSREAGGVRENVFNLRIRQAAGTLDSSADLGKQRRDLARVLTVLNQKKKAAQTPAQAAEKKG